ncbi:hypothetical protein SAMN05421771_2589 [Granulicella pectinivorans]|jgi:hypothetical protein|uniref:Uncharacterized protein n=1 Tax=Granulicella pectinivorans TaxID=474950 RepID=A0A1I6MGL4_9BACT|nr:hypothetical protein [Granulicella pectinivorans]SFS14737.1 hypothetical protein SAMN05421771_2589 [Granulicella pectinivorans]
MSTVDISTNPQITQDDEINPKQTEQQKIDEVAGQMAQKAGKVEHHSETSDNVGGVRSTSGGIFTK